MTPSRPRPERNEEYGKNFRVRNRFWNQRIELGGTVHVPGKLLAIKNIKKIIMDNNDLENEPNEEQIEEQDSIQDETENEVVEFRYAITSYGADYPVDSIVNRVDRGSIFVPPFQRKYVWKLTQASKFIESLILGLPVPGVFLSKEQNSARHLIVDGQQRILTLSKFYEGLFNGREFKLRGVQEDLEGKTYRTLSTDDQTRLDDSIIHSTIIKQDAPSDDESSIYMIFERLNTGGTPLKPQEIRACIFYGELNEFLISSTENDHWRNVFGNPNTRMKEEELILRFFALYYELDNYQKPLKTFLNMFMSRNRNFSLYSRDALNSLFNSTIDFISQHLGRRAFRRGTAINAAMFDAVMIATARLLSEGTNIDAEQFVTNYQQLVENEEFKNFTTGGTSDETAVRARIEIASQFLIN